MSKQKESKPAKASMLLENSSSSTNQVNETPDIPTDVFPEKIDEESDLSEEEELSSEDDCDDLIDTGTIKKTHLV